MVPPSRCSSRKTIGLWTSCSVQCLALLAIAGQAFPQAGPSPGDAAWSAAVSSASVAPQLFETGSAYLLFSLALVVVCFGALRLRGRRLGARETELTRVVEERTAQLRRHESQLEMQNAQLEAQARRLEELDQAKSRFFANLSHEFRTPLTLTIGPLEDLRSGLRGPVSDEVATDLDLALRNSRRLLRLVNQILDLSRLEGGQLTPRVREDDLGELVRCIATSFAPLAERKRISFEIDIPEEDLCAFFDADLMEKVFTNLLSNAFKFTPVDRTVRVAVEAHSELESPTLTVSVRDSGPGIRAEDIDHIFERFYRARDSVAPGTGIGLSLAKELVELHGGHIEVGSEPGFGSEFRVCVRRGSGHLPKEWFVRADGESTDEPVSPQPPGEDAGPMSDVTPLIQDTEDPVDRTTVLIVEDHDDVREYLRRQLSPSFRVIEASHGEEGLDVARNDLPDVIVSDVMMPGMDGSELCRRIKANAATSFIPVILLTARATQQDKLEGLEGGADAYLTKPFDPLELTVRIRNLVRSRHRLWEHARYEGRLVPDDPQADSADERFLVRLRQTIEAHIDDEDFDVEALAAGLGYSRSSLYRRLEGLVQDSPAGIILGVRLDRAAQLLAARAGTVSEVAYGVGFKSVSHFSRRFRGRFGVPPSEYAQVAVQSAD